MKMNDRAPNHGRVAAALMAALLFLVLFLPGQVCAVEKKVRPPETRVNTIDLTTAIVRVAKQTIPAVVHIEVTARQEVATPSLPFDDPFFRYFFGVPNTPRKYRREARGIGTGMIIDGQGHILTNYHVAGGATKIEVLLSDGRKLPAKLVGGDPKTDLAVIKIVPAERLPYVTFGDSDRTEVGEWVVAIGHPRGLDQTVTQGIISAKHRRGITDPSSYQDFLQTDAAINPGNSGGPLLNLKGEVIGVNTVIVSSSGGFEGIGLAIPSNMATHVAKTLIAHGKVERGWLGVGIQDVSQEQAKAAGLPAPRGAYIAEVVKNGPADRAGLKTGDIVVSYNGKAIQDGAALRNEVSVTPVGKEGRLSVVRQGKRQEIVVKVGSPQEAAKALSSSVRARLGAEVRALTQKEREKLGLEPNQGVAVSAVDAKGPLAQAGFEVGDFILEVNGQAVAGVEGFAELVGAMRPRQRISLLAVDQKTGNSGYVQVVTR